MATMMTVNSVKTVVTCSLSHKDRSTVTLI